MIQDTERFKMDLVGSLERTLHGKVKPSMHPSLTCGWAYALVLITRK